MLFSPGEIEAVKKSVDLVALIRSSGVELTKKGKNYVGRCPYHHPDKTPSLIVSPDKGLWNCLGACRNNGHPSGGDAIGWLVRLKGIPFREAMTELGAVPREESIQEKASKDIHLPVSDLLDTVTFHYHESLLSSKEARSYLESRKLWSPDLLKAFRVGYADGSLSERIGKAPIKKDLRTLGVFTGSWREMFKGCIVVPLMTGDAVTGLYARKIEGTQHLYLPGPRKGLINARGARDAERLVLCESILDALSLLILGEPGALPLWGINGWTEDHEAFLKTWTGKDLMLCMDTDEAGKGVSGRLAKELSSYNPRILDLSPFKDPNDLLCKAEDPRKTWSMRLGPSKLPLAAKEEKKVTPPDPSHDGHSYTFEDRRYSVRGLKGYGLDKLKVTVRLDVGDLFNLDTLDFYSQRAREHFSQAAEKLLKADPAKVNRDLLKLAEKLETHRARLKEDKSQGKEAAEMTATEREEALQLLKDPNLLDRILDDMEKLGCVGEREALALGVLGTISRLLDKPLGLLLLARSGAGKTTVQDAVCDFVPEENLAKYTRITGQALFYKEEDALVHKVLAIEEEGGAESARYAIRNLQSAQTLSIATARTDPVTGKLRTDTYNVKGPVFIMLTTTNPDALDYETRNRFLEATVNESHEQTKRILKAQREEDTLEGLLRQAKRDRLMRLHQNVQRLLRPLKVLNPFAGKLTYPSHGLKMRREQKKYLTLLKTMALLYQHQRPVKKASKDGVSIEYVEITKEDIERVSRIAGKALARGLDELSSPSRSLFEEIRTLVHRKGEELRKDLPPESPVPEPTITRKELRQATGWTEWQLRVHLQELVDMEYVAVVFGGNGRRTQYALLEDSEDAPPDLVTVEDDETL